MQRCVTSPAPFKGSGDSQDGRSQSLPFITPGQTPKLLQLPLLARDYKRDQHHQDPQFFLVTIKIPRLPPRYSQNPGTSCRSCTWRPSAVYCVAACSRRGSGGLSQARRGGVQHTDTAAALKRFCTTGELFERCSAMLLGTGPDCLHAILLEHQGLWAPLVKLLHLRWAC
jgi:hypothetical protein